MMKAVNCPVHGNQVLELARGELGDHLALEAEEHLENCAHCSAWWNETFSSESFFAVDRIVTQTFAEVEPPRQRRRLVWAAAASILVMVAGLSWVNLPNMQKTASAPSTASIEMLDFETDTPVAEIQAISFEEPDLMLADKQPVNDDAAMKADDTVLFEDDGESGDFGNWAIHT